MLQEKKRFESYDRSGFLPFRRPEARSERGRRRLKNTEAWKRDEHWTAVMTHLAGLHVSNEG